MTAITNITDASTCTEYVDEVDSLVEQYHSEGHDAFVLRWESDLSDGYSDIYYEIFKVEDRDELKVWLEQELTGPNGSSFDLPGFGELIPDTEVEAEAVLFGSDYVELIAIWMPTSE